MNQSICGQFNTSRIDNNQLCVAQDSLFNPCANNGMVLRWVRAEEKDRACLLDSVTRPARSTGAARPLHAGRRWRMTYPSAAINVVRSNDDARKFLGQVVFLVRSAGRSENSDAVGTKFGRNLPQPLGHEPDCF